MCAWQWERSPLSFGGRTRSEDANQSFVFLRASPSIHRVPVLESSLMDSKSLVKQLRIEPFQLLLAKPRLALDSFADP